MNAEVGGQGPVFMAVLQSIRNLFTTPQGASDEEVIPAPPATYSIRTLTSQHIKELLQLNLRCFENGDNYTKHTFAYLLSEPRTLSYRVATGSDELVGFAFAMMTDNGGAHLTTIGIAPEHRRRHLAQRLLSHMEAAIKRRGIATMMLEVRVSNVGAQSLYRGMGYTVVQRIAGYYSNGEDCFLMMKPLGI